MAAGVLREQTKRKPQADLEHGDERHRELSLPHVRSYAMPSTSTKSMSEAVECGKEAWPPKISTIVEIRVVTGPHGSMSSQTRKVQMVPTDT